MTSTDSIVKPFSVTIADETIDTIKARVDSFPWHEMPDDGGWGYGTNLDYMREFCSYWVNEFDWRKQERQINRFSHFKTPFCSRYAVREQPTRPTENRPRQIF